jgi:uncharacterized protein with ACT and thioredoxin-like domain
MVWLVFALLLVLGVAGLLVSDAIVGGVMQILLISTLVALGIQRIRAVSTRMRRYQVD